MRTFVENSSDDFLMTIEAFQILKGLQIETPNERPIWQIFNMFMI